MINTDLGQLGASPLLFSLAFLLRIPGTDITHTFGIFIEADFLRKPREGEISTSWTARWVAESYLCHLGCHPHWPAGTSCLYSPRCYWEGWGTRPWVWLLSRLPFLIPLCSQGCHCRHQVIIMKRRGAASNCSQSPHWALMSLHLHTPGMMLDTVESYSRQLLPLKLGTTFSSHN